jgi:hypothetical protein
VCVHEIHAYTQAARDAFMHIEAGVDDDRRDEVEDETKRGG